MSADDVASASVVERGGRSRISVVMATCNGAAFIEQQLVSLLTQTRPPLELIVSDDRSDDDTYEIAQRVLADAPFPVTFVRNTERLGYADNFLEAADRAAGDHIAFCDQDDVWLPHKLETLEGWLRDFPTVSLLVHRGEVVDTDLRPLAAYHPDITHTVRQAPQRGRLTARPPGFAMCFNRRLLTDFAWRERPQDLLFADSRSKHDTWIATLADTVGGIRYSDEILVRYRRHGRNFSAFRKGSNVNRRLGQLRDAFRPAEAVAMKTLREGLEQHARFFEAAAIMQPDLQASLTTQAQRYRNARSSIDRRLALSDATGIQSFTLLFDNLRSGCYRQDGRLDRRALAQDAATAVRNLFRTRLDRV